MERPSRCLAGPGAGQGPLCYPLGRTPSLVRPTGPPNFTEMLLMLLHIAAFLPSVAALWTGVQADIAARVNAHRLQKEAADALGLVTQSLSLRKRKERLFAGKNKGLEQRDLADKAQELVRWYLALAPAPGLHRG